MTGEPVQEDEHSRTEDRGSRATLWAAGLLTLALVVLVALIVLLHHDLRSYSDRSGSMLPTLTVGQRFEVDLGARSPRRGQIVVFHAPRDISTAYIRCPRSGQGFNTPYVCGEAGAQPGTEVFVKRVVGVPGDRIALVDGRLIRDGGHVDEPYARGCTDAALCTFPRPVTVPAGQYFVLGDNRGASDDSRFFGPIRRSWIVGTVVRCHLLQTSCSPVR